MTHHDPNDFGLLILIRFQTSALKLTMVDLFSAEKNNTYNDRTNVHGQMVHLNLNYSNLGLCTRLVCEYYLIIGANILREARFNSLATMALFSQTGGGGGRKVGGPQCAY